MRKSESLLPITWPNNDKEDNVNEDENDNKDENGNEDKEEDERKSKTEEEEEDVSESLAQCVCTVRGRGTKWLQGRKSEQGW